MTKVDFNKVKDQLFHSNKTIQKNSKMWRARNRKKATISKNSLSQKVSTKAKSRRRYIRNVYKNLTPETAFKRFLKVLSKFHTQYSQEEYDEIIDKNIDVGLESYLGELFELQKLYNIYFFPFYPEDNFVKED